LNPLIGQFLPTQFKKSSTLRSLKTFAHLKRETKIDDQEWKKFIETTSTRIKQHDKDTIGTFFLKNQENEPVKNVRQRRMGLVRPSVETFEALLVTHGMDKEIEDAKKNESELGELKSKDVGESKSKDVGESEYQQKEEDEKQQEEIVIKEEKKEEEKQQEEIEISEEKKKEKQQEIEIKEEKKEEEKQQEEIEIKEEKKEEVEKRQNHTKRNEYLYYDDAKEVHL